MSESGATPPLYFLLSLLAAVGIAFGTPGARLLLPGAWLAGGAFIVAGLALNLVASRQFERQQIPIRPGSRSGSLATSGLFRISRNPMYLGMVLIQVGAVVGLGSPIGLVVPASFVLLMNRRFIRHEEELLRTEFGHAYAQYSARVRRWI